ncbi:MAG: HEAT repeat domain-containing protein [Chlamydiia bacterium]|nr:HEAT repeat domain-containing protein [Chlamydiia bacterium]
MFWIRFFLPLLMASFLFSSERDISKYQVLYLIQAGEVEKGIHLYQGWAAKAGKHDFSLLEQMGHLLLSLGAHSQDEEALLLSMYGLGTANSLEGMKLYALGMESRNPMTQMATIHFLTPLQDDAVEGLLFKAFTSPYLAVQMEAAHALSMRRSNQVTGMLDALSQKLPPYLHVYFPELYAMIGTPDAIGFLKSLVAHPYLHVRLAAILAAAKHGRDDFLTDIRAAATHSDHAEQETCARALGYLKDAHSIPLLKTLASSQQPSVKLAAAYSLTYLGDHTFREPIIEAALRKDLLALPMLADIPHTEPLLTSLLSDFQFQIRANAALVLLKKRSSAALPTLLKMVIKDEKDWGFQPVYSLGQSMMAWKAIPSSTHYGKKMKQDIPSMTLALREQILQEAMELPEEDFLTLARAVFKAKQNELIPILIHLLENLKSEKVISLLKEESRRAGAPFIRAYCHLALYRMKMEGPHADFVYEWVKNQKHHELFQFREMLSWTERQDSSSPFTLTPKETSRLLLEAYETLAESHEMRGIDLLLSAIREGTEKNRYALAGLLLKAIQ